MYFYKILMVKVLIIALKYVILQNTIIRINVPGALRNCIKFHKSHEHKQKIYEDHVQKV